MSLKLIPPEFDENKRPTEPESTSADLPKTDIPKAGDSPLPAGQAGSGPGRAITILFLAANPRDTQELQLNEEVRAIDRSLRLAAFRDQFRLEQHWAVRYGDLLELFLRHQPDIVHFSGHGSHAGEIILQSNTGESHPVSARALSTLFSALKDNVRCVVLNACYSEIQAQAIAQHIDAVVGMNTAIGDAAAIEFATAFYQAIGFGRSVKTAFEVGCVQIDLDNLNEQETPRLLALNSDPAQIILATETDKLPTDDDARAGRNSGGTHINTGGGAYIGHGVNMGQGDFIGRDKVVHGDEVRGDKVAGDKFTVGNISDSQGLAFGRGAQANVSHGVAGPDLSQLFAPLLQAVQTAPPVQRQEAEGKVQALQEEVAKGPKADDSLMASLVEDLVALAPGAVSTVVGLFATPLLSGIAGNVTNYVLERIRRRPAQ